MTMQQRSRPSGRCLIWQLFPRCVHPVGTAPGHDERAKTLLHGHLIPIRHAASRPLEQYRPDWKSQSDFRPMKLLVKYKPERFATVEFLPFGLDWTHVAEIRFSENKG